MKGMTRGEMRQKGGRASSVLDPSVLSGKHFRSSKEQTGGGEDVSFFMIVVDGALEQATVPPHLIPTPQT